MPFFAPVNGNKAQLIYEDQAVPLSHSLTELSLAIATPVPTATPTSTSTPTPTATPTATFTPASVAAIAGTPSSFSLPLPSQASSIFRMGEVSNQGVKFSLERIDFWTTLPDGARPTKDIFVVFTGLLSALDTGSSTHCVGGSDVELHIGASVYQMDNMRSVNRFYQSDFPGYILPQCVSGEPQTTFFIFDAKVTTDPIHLFFHAAQLDIDSSLSHLAPVAAITANSAAIQAQLPTVTPDLASPVGLLTITVTANRNANLRAGPSTEHEAVATVPAGQNLAVVATNEDASWYLLDTGAWIAAFLVDPANDLSELSRLPVHGAANQSSATPSSSGLDVFNDPNRVCDALVDEGWVPLADRLAKWSSIDGEGYLYSCVTDSIQVTPGGFSQVGDVPNTMAKRS
ncbi:MAG: hypothetical protein DCC55_29935 [Chloroflexi bacterium]|nr:MAG: hypothetical protein DCC55_29935 [Chloroflexota bacterium]